MKAGCFVLLFALCALARAATSVGVVTGEVLEIREVESYTYLRLKTPDGPLWAAVAKTPVKKGSRVTIDNVVMMSDFESKTLKRTFPIIAFGNLVGVPPITAAQAGTPAAPSPATVDVVVTKADGPNAFTVAQIVANAAQRKDKPVTLRGKVVKVNAGIMGKNWLHLRDGSGTATDNSNDILVTTQGSASLGDVVTVRGIVRTDKDFGAGYAYKVLIEEATLAR